MSTKDLLSALHPSLTDEQKAILAQFLEERETEVAKLKTQLEKVKQVAFKRSSEKIPPTLQQVGRALNAEEVAIVEARLAAQAGAAGEAESADGARTRRTRANRIVGRRKSEGERKRKRTKRIETLPIVVQQVDVADGEWPEDTSAANFREVNSPGRGTTHFGRSYACRVQGIPAREVSARRRPHGVCAGQGTANADARRSV